MSLHCRDWTENLTGPYPDVTFDDGDDWDDIYSNARCSRWEVRGTFYLDDDGDQYSSERDLDDAPECQTHAVSASEDHPRVQEALEQAGFSTCGECETVYHEFHAWALHDAEEHGGDATEDDEDDGTAYQRQDEHGNYTPIPPSQGRVRITRREPVTTHSSWA